LLKVMTEITVLGGGTILTLMTFMVVAYLFTAKRVRTAVFVIGAVSGGAILSSVLKSLFGRPRPDVVSHLVDVSSASFPSGHAMNSALTYLTLGVLLAKTETNPAVRIYLISMAVVLTVLVGISRVYLGVHWPTDVIAGWCVGSLWALGCSLIAERFVRRRSLEPDKV
jgi:undecaprenyl-diphosphatase